jgi:uncharacterized protein involved in response to NO
MKSNQAPVLFSYAFRPFFLLGAVFAVLIIFLWALTLHGSGLSAATPLWHGHEMLVGFALTAVARFSLTAVANWTGRPAIQATPLGLLVLCWLAGRSVMLMSSRLPAGFVVLLDMLFPVLLVGLSASFIPTHWLTGWLAFAAAIVHGFRLSHWKGLATTSNPLLFVLHIAYLWLPVGYALLGCAVFGWIFTPTAALHALTMGAIGGMVLAVTTRVALGHTGRPLHAARLTVFAYWILMLTVLIRVLGPLTGKSYLMMIDLAASGWMLAFAIFTWVYWPILSGPRAD